MGIMVIKDVERSDIEFICRVRRRRRQRKVSRGADARRGVVPQTLACKPVAHVDSFTADKLGRADLVEEVDLTGDGHKVTKITGVPNPGRTVTLLCRGSNKLVLDEAERSLHDALCVVRSIVQKKFLIAGGGSAEVEVALQLTNWSKTLSGTESFCVREYADVRAASPRWHCTCARAHPRRCRPWSSSRTRWPRMRACRPSPS